MIRVGGAPGMGEVGQDVEFCGLIYPDGDEISKHMAARLSEEPFYQSDKLFAALAVAKRRRMAIDCGAWVGGWSRELAKHFQRVMSIEANPDNARCVQKNVAENVAVLNVALGDETGEIFVAKDRNGPNVGSYVSKETGVKVQIRRLDDLVGAINQVEPASIDYIKIHVNGMELKALRGAVKTILKHRPVLTVVLKAAIENFGDSAEAARAFLTEDLRYVPAGGERPYEIWTPK